MPDLDAIAARHGVGLDSVRHLLDALARGHGRMAQFNHPDLGGMGQWSAGGMTMIGDMFNSGLKARVVALCDELAPLAAGENQGSGWGSSQSQSQGSGSGGSWNQSGGGSWGGSWWPDGLGQPATSGSQNDARYAFFPESRRLAIETGGRVTLYDTGDHQIGGVSQQQGSSHSLSFTSQYGPVRLEELPVVGAPSQDAGSAAHIAPQAAPAPAPEAYSPPASSAPADAPAAPAGDVFGMIERLSELHRKGVLTEAEFAAKKTELLARL